MHKEFRELRRKWAKFIDVHRALFAKTGLPLSLAEDHGRFLQFLDHGYFEDRSDPYVWERDASEEQKVATKELLRNFYADGFRYTGLGLGPASKAWEREFQSDFGEQ